MIARTLKAFTLWEFIGAHLLTLKYFFKPKATINYPFEKAPTSPRFRGGASFPPCRVRSASTVRL